MAKLNGESLNIEEENIKKLIELFPEVNTDGKIDFGKLKQILGDYVDDSEERYRFVWNGKGEALRISQTPSTGTLRPDKESSKNWDETENLYIEGDNLEVLKLLQKSYFGKVKMIYIDPPYNTGRDIIYKNNFHDPINYYKAFTGQVDEHGFSFTTNTEHDGRYHTNWLNLMYPRLRISSNFLRDDGIIVVSIDQYELGNLLKMMDELFGYNNRLGIITVVSKPEGRNQEKFFATSTEYAVFYAKNKSKCSFYPVILDENIRKTFDRRDKRGKYKLSNYIRTGGGDVNKRENKPHFYYPVYVSKDLNKISIEELNNSYIVYPITSHERTWKTKKETLQKRIDDGEIVAEKDNNNKVQIYEKFREDRGQLIKTHWIDKKYNFINNGTKVLEGLLDGKYFDFPKAIGYIKDILRLCIKDDEIVLDFFAGSSTTAHAVMDLNAEDSGNRKFIMVQLPELTDEKSEAYKAGYKNIAEIGKERIRRAGEQIKQELADKYEKASEEERKNMKHPDELDIGFRTFKLDSSNIKEWNPGKYENIQTAIEDFETPYVPGRTEEDVVYEMMLKMGLDLTLPIEEVDVNGKTIYSIGYGLLMICLDENIDQTIAQKMIEIKNENHLDEFRVIFRDEGFASDTDKTNIKETLRSAGLAEESFMTL